MAFQLVCCGHELTDNILFFVESFYILEAPFSHLPPIRTPLE